MAAKELSETHRRVFQILVKSKAMPFLELASVAGVREEHIGQILGDLETQGFVKRSRPHDPCEDIVTVREKGFDTWIAPPVSSGA